MNETIIPVILCGGAGSRLWPASRETYPKQLVRLRTGAFAVSGGIIARHRPGIRQVDRRDGQ